MQTNLINKRLSPSVWNKRVTYSRSHLAIVCGILPLASVIQRPAQKQQAVLAQVDIAQEYSFFLFVAAVSLAG